MSEEYQKITIPEYLEYQKLKQENARLLNQLKEANAIITHVVFDSKDSSNIAYDYLAKHGLIKAER